MRGILLPLLAAAGLMAQTPPVSDAPPNPLMNAVQMNQFCKRVSQLMESGGVAVPDLQRAASPIVASTKETCVQIEAKPNASQPVFALMSSLRTYLMLSDAVPKPFPFPEAAARQFAELRDGSTRLETHFRALLDSKEARLANPDRDNLKRYAEANRKLAQPEASKPRVVFFGDSITDFWRLNEYFPDRDYVNRGISGQVTGEMLGRFKADVIDLHPAAVLILAGTNDLARNVPLSTIENNYLMMADLADAYKIKVIFASVLPVSDYHKDVNKSFERTPGRPPIFIRALNDWIAAFCVQRHHTYLNYYTPMVDETTQMKTDLADDGLHPNPMGYRIMAPLAQEAVQRALPPPRPAATQPTAPTAKPVRRRATSN